MGAPSGKALLLLMLLAALSLAYNDKLWKIDDCPSCKPAVKVANCNQPQCYHCGTNEVLNQATLYCECQPGFQPINGYCGKCREGYQYDPVLMQCVGVNPCGINQELVNGTCKCLSGLQVIQNFCQRCPANQTYFAQFDACRCSEGYSLVNGSCIFVTCLVNEVYSVDAQACVCGFGYYRINGTCGQCLLNQIFSPATNSCLNNTPPTCGLHEYWFEICCFCEIGYVRISGVCVTCPAHSSYDWNTDSCVCDPGWYFVGEEVKQLPYQYQDTGSSFTTNPSYSYSYKAPSNGIPSQEPTIVQGSNYDASGININGPNINNVYTVPPINSGRG
jgi:hypothetical protein